MFLERRNISLVVILFTTIILIINPAYSKTFTRNVTVKMNKPEIIWKHWIINTRFDRGKAKCEVYKPPDMRIWKKPKFGKLTFKKNVVIDHAKMSDADKKNCKGKIVKATAVEFTGDKKGKISFKVEVYYRQGRYEEHIFGDVLFNVNVR